MSKSPTHETRILFPTHHLHRPSFINHSVDDRPATTVVTNEVDAELRSSCVVVVVVDQHIAITVGKNSVVARTVDEPVARHHLRAATLHHLLAALVDVRPGHTRGPADHDAVGAGGTLAAPVEGHP